MSRQGINDENIRKLQRTGEDGTTYTVSLPLELVQELGWQKTQKVVVTKRGNELIIKDWSE